MQKKTKITILAAAFCAAGISAYAAEGDAPIYSVTFDDVSS